MNLAPLPTGILRMRAGLDELVFYPDQRPILPDRLSAMAGSGQPLLPELPAARPGGGFVPFRV